MRYLPRFLFVVRIHDCDGREGVTRTRNGQQTSTGRRQRTSVAAITFEVGNSFKGLGAELAPARSTTTCRKERGLPYLSPAQFSAFLILAADERTYMKSTVRQRELPNETNPEQRLQKSNYRKYA